MMQGIKDCVPWGAQEGDRAADEDSRLGWKQAGAIYSIIADACRSQSTGRQLVAVTAGMISGYL
jgi:hypothetical protein